MLSVREARGMMQLGLLAGLMALPQYPGWDRTRNELPEEFEAVLEWLQADGCPELPP